jgi:hypothetical protein
MDAGFYRYAGSVTTPPCSETVKWFVLRTPSVVSQAQVDAFAALLYQGNDNRPVQSRNGRGVFKDTFPGCYVEYAQRRLASGSAPGGYAFRSVGHSNIRNAPLLRNLPSTSRR